MAGESTTIWELDPHTGAKHVILRKYLDAWLPILTRWNGRVVIIDGFAGPGRYSKGEEGSPVIALRAFLEHSHKAKMNAKVKYLFVESDKARYESLKEVVSQIKLPMSVDVDIFNEKCEVTLTRALNYLDERESRLAPTFAFIDPFGLQVPLDIVSRLMAHQKCEVLITFMIGALHRFISTPEFEESTDRLFGCADWREAFEMRGDEREAFLRALYQRQLEEAVGAAYVRFFSMRNAKNRAIYDLFFATKHPAGIDAMKDAMWKIDQTGSYSFSDATNPDQETLFSEEPDWDQMFDLLAEQFKGTEQPWIVVEDAIRRTPFRILKRPLQAESRKKNSRFRIIPPVGGRRGTLKVGSMVRFE